MLDAAFMTVHVGQMTGMAEIDACYDMVTVRGCKTLEVEAEYGLEAGKPASLRVLDAESRYDASCRRPTVLFVISRGKLLAQTEPPVTKWQL